MTAKLADPRPLRQRPSRAGFDRRLLPPMVLVPLSPGTARRSAPSGSPAPCRRRRARPACSSCTRTGRCGALLAFGAVLGGPQGLIGLATQNALYRRAEPERTGSATDLPRTFMYPGALSASAATAAFFPQRADTAGLHGLALFMLAGSALLPATTLPDRSPGSLTPRESRTTRRKA